MNINILRNTLAASAVLVTSTALHAAEPNMDNNHFQGVSVQAGINFENTGKNEYILDSKYDNISANASIFTDANKTKAHEGNTDFTLKYDKLSYERDNNLQIGGELGVTYRQPMGEHGLLVGGYVGVSYNFDNEHSYNFNANGNGGGEQSAEEAFKEAIGLTGDTKSVNLTTMTKDAFSSSGEERLVTTDKFILTKGNLQLNAQPDLKVIANKDIPALVDNGQDNTLDVNAHIYEAAEKAGFSSGSVSVSKTSFKASNDITVKVKNDFSFIFAGTVGMPVTDRLLLEGMIGLKIDTYKFNATASGLTISDLGRETTNRNLKDIVFKDKNGLTLGMKFKATKTLAGGALLETTAGNQIRVSNYNNIATLDVTPTLHGDKIKSVNYETVTGTESWSKGDALYAANADESQKTEEKSKMCYKGYVGLRAIFNVKDNLDLGVKGYVAFPLKSEYELELSKKEGSTTLLEATFKPKMQFGGGLFVSYSF